MNKSVWQYDCAGYGGNSVQLFYTFIHEPSQWLSLLVGIIESKPPMISWIGQFFVPLGYIIGSIDTGLLLFVFITIFITIVLLFHILKELFKKKLVSYVGCLIIAASPPLFHYLTRYLVEPLQLLSVVWFIYIMVFALKWDWFYILLQLIAATSFAMLVKISSPLFCFGPGIVALIYVFRSRLSFVRFTKRHFIMCFFAGVLAFGCLAWYGRNLTRAVGYAFYSTTVWGIKDTFWSKLVYWLASVQKLFFMPNILFIIVPLFTVAVYLFFRQKDKKQTVNIAALVAVLHFILILSVFSLSTNQTRRFLLPLLPYLVILICWSLSKVNKTIVTALVLVIFCIQLLLVDTLAFGIIKPKPYFPRVMRLNKGQEVARKVDAINEIIRITCNAEGQLNMIGLYAPWLNPATFRYYRLKKLSPNHINCKYEQLISPRDYYDRHLKHPTEEKTWKRLLSRKPAYFLSVNPKYYGNDKGNGNKKDKFLRDMGVGLLERVKGSEIFEQVTLPNYPEVLLFKYKGQDNP